MKHLLYKILIYPLTFFNFFKYGIPYCYLSRSNIDEQTKKHTYRLSWYFNNKPNKNILNKNYSNQKFLGYKKSLFHSYKQLLKC